MRLKKLIQTNSDQLYLAWDDGHEGPVSLRTLRDGCPCASCSGEQVLLHQYVPPEQDTSTPGRYVLKAASAVGSYALQFSWGDGHNLGIYTWGVLRDMCECGKCIDGRKSIAGGGRRA